MAEYNKETQKYIIGIYGKMQEGHIVGYNTDTWKNKTVIHGWIQYTLGTHGWKEK